MNFFKNKKNELKPEEKIEIVEFEKEDQNIIEKKKDNRIIIIVIIFLIAFVLFLPYINSIFKKDSAYNYTTEVKNNTSKNTINGMLLIGNENGYIKINNIQFYLFQKRSDNKIAFSFKVDKKISSVSNLNLYIEFYNKSESLIYRAKFLPSEKLSKGVFSEDIELNPTFYSEAYYVKLINIDFSKININDSLICKKTTKSGDVEIKQEVQYNFSTSILLSYEVKKEIIMLEEGNNEHLEELNNEQKDVMTIGGTSTLIDNVLSYKIDLKNVDLSKSNYTLLYNLGDTKRTIEFNEVSNNWQCE